MLILGKIRTAYLYLEALAFDRRAEDPLLPRPKFFTHMNQIDYLIAPV